MLHLHASIASHCLIYAIGLSATFDVIPLFIVSGNVSLSVA
ncbi:MAG: hypothetical protein Q8S84_09695 [bacterium]|nr:hypothetical protein [bacterium]